MYKHPHQRSINNPLPIRLNAINFDKRAIFVESICAVLIESRFGPGRACQFFVDPSDRPELEPAVFSDLSDEGLIPCYAIPPLGRAGIRSSKSNLEKQNRWASSALDL